MRSEGPEGGPSGRDRGRVEAHRLTHHYGPVRALHGVSVDVEPGECLALVGESGSGKTTLLRCFNRMVEPEAGEVRVDGKDVRRSDPVELRRSIGYVQQDGGLMPHWTVARNVALVPWLRHRRDIDRRTKEALDLVGLSPATFGDRWPAQLSGGQRQRVAIARALADHPAILLMDEPFAALDAITRFELHDSFLALRRRIRATCVLVTHDLREALKLGDRVGVMKDGRLEQVASAKELAEAPASGYVATLLAKAEVG